jgi:hypothetical protein
MLWCLANRSMLLRSTSMFKIGYVLIVIGLLCCFSVAAADTAEQDACVTCGVPSVSLVATERLYDIRSSSLQDAVIRTPLAPGYCISNGGSTAYEYISSVDYTLNPSGTMIITVDIFIDNPGGCTYGNPCPEYDPSPEYVNAWIDWDGDGDFEAHERVLDEDLTGYGAINYFGTMTTSTIVTIPDGAVDMTWMRVNLGWDHDPDDPCELSWTWGDVYDEKVSTLTDFPFIEDIIVHGPAGDDANPTTTHPVTLEAVLHTSAGFTVTGISWTGDGIPAGATGNNYVFTPAAGTHGRKTVQCIITYENTAGETGDDMKTVTAPLFFDKNGDYDSDAIPNWFEYWAADGAVPRLTDAYYVATMTGYGCWNCGGRGRVELGPAAAGQHYGSAIVLTTHFGTESFGGPGTDGIDSAAEVVEHEFTHKWVSDMWADGWSGDTDSDDGVPTADCDDDLPDHYETGTTFTSNSDTDTYDLEHKKSSIYRTYGDQEYLCLRKGDTASGLVANDWANPGKQTTPAGYDMEDVQVRAVSPAIVEFTGAITDKGTDINRDGFYEYLTVRPEVSVKTAGSATIVGVLKGPRGVPVATLNIPLTLETGVQTLDLNFPGVEIREFGWSGVFGVDLELGVVDDDPIILDTLTATTASYAYTVFQPRAARFTGAYAESVPDRNNNDYYDELVIAAELDVREAGTYAIEGWIRGQKDRDVIADDSIQAYFNKGLQTVKLVFEGPAIRQHRINGPYVLSDLTISKPINNFEIERIPVAYTTASYPANRFEGREAEFTGVFTSRGEDTNNNKRYDYLAVTAEVKVNFPGSYLLKGTVVDASGNAIGEASTRKFFGKAGTYQVDLRFTGKEIFLNEKNGPFFLKDAVLLGDDGILDAMTDAHRTDEYPYAQFQPLILLLDDITTYGYDADNDRLFDELRVCAKVLSTDNGNCIMFARLMDDTGREVGWAKKTATLTHNEPATICLSFSGQELYAHRVNGRLTVKDVFVYHTGDAFVPDYSGDDYETTPYSYTQFEKAGTVAGTVTDRLGTPVEGALISIEGVDVSPRRGHYWKIHRHGPGTRLLLPLSRRKECRSGCGRCRQMQFRARTRLKRERDCRLGRCGEARLYVMGLHRR